MFNREVLPDDLRSELQDHASLAFSEARMLPLEVYRSSAVLEREITTIFGTDWLCLGRTAEIPENGDWFTAALPRPGETESKEPGNRSVIVVRGDDGEIRALENICIHRGAELLDGCGNLNRITCPYHAWVYRLDGQLLAGPYMQETTEADGSPFDPTRHQLGKLTTEVWEGFIFVSQADDPEPLAGHLTGLNDVVGRYAMERYVPVFSTVDVWPTNWKILVENFMDAYHVFKVHKESFGADGDNTRFTNMYPGTDHWAHHRVLNPADPDMCQPTNTSLEGDWRKTIILGAIFPGFVIQLQPDWLWFLRITPLGTDRCRIAWQVAITPETLDAKENPETYIKEVMDLIHLVNSEDHPIVEGIRRNVDRPQFNRAPLSYLERNVYDFDRYLARKLLD